MNVQTQKKLAVWIADDSAAEREVARRVLSADYDVRIFVDGEGLIEALSQEALPDAVVLDWVMPGISGIEACQYIRTNKATERLPLLLLTSNDRPEDVAAGLDAGANDFVGKPFHSVELLARLRSIIRAEALRTRAERAEESAHELLEGVPDALITLRPERTILYANAEAAKMLGKRPEELVGMQINDAIPDLKADQIPEVAVEKITLPDVRHGSRTYAAVVRPLLMPQGLTTTVSLRDVTAQRLLETRRLDFYSVIAHELRSPMTAIGFRLGLILKGKGGEPNPVHREYLEKTLHRLKSLDELINDFLDLARMDATGLHLNRAPMDLCELIHDVGAEFEQVADAGGVSLDYQGQGSAAREVFADSRRVRQVVFNLISNAIKFTPRGGRVRVALDDPERGSVRVVVEDTGVGVSELSRQQLFTRYTRGTGRAEGISGTGLGLMIVKEIIEAHEGSVGVDSVEGHGSSFWFRLPAAATAHRTPSVMPTTSLRSASEAG